MPLILHCGSHSATREQLRAVPVPDQTDTWYPLGYGPVLDTIDDAVRAANFQVADEGFGLNRKGNQMFGVMTLRAESDESDIALGLRQSLDKSLALGIAVGARVFVCDNLAFSSDTFHIVRRNTRYVQRDFTALATKVVENALEGFGLINEKHGRWKTIPVDLEEGYEYLGIGLGRKVITPHVASKAFKAWRNPPHAAFNERNAWTFYNALTEGAKSVRPGNQIDTHIAIRSFMDSIT